MAAALVFKLLVRHDVLALLFAYSAGICAIAGVLCLGVSKGVGR